MLLLRHVLYAIALNLMPAAKRSLVGESTCTTVDVDNLPGDVARQR